jgi:hypothetical protein
MKNTTNLQYTEFEEFSLKDHPDFNESWVEERIIDNPSLLKLGSLEVKDRQRRQKFGILDLLLVDPIESRRYEVEIQLGATDETHIIRTIEYWDIERQKYPADEHIAVIIAEDITSRFLNVISLFNRSIPIIAIQMKAIKNGNNVGLFFTTVLDLTLVRPIEEDDESDAIADREYWEEKVGKEQLSLIDDFYNLSEDSYKNRYIRYKKGRIVLSRKDRKGGGIVFHPRNNFTLCQIPLKQSEERTRRLESSGLDTMSYKYQKYRVRLRPGDIMKHKDIFLKLLQELQETNTDGTEEDV